MLSEFVGMGLDNLIGKKWVIERRTLNPFFYHDVLKGMVEGIVKGVASELHKCEEEVRREGGSAEIDVEEYIHAIAGKTIAQTAFGTDHEKATQISKMQKEYTILFFELLSSGMYWIPGFRFLPTRKNREMARLRSRIDKLLLEVIQDRQRAAQRGESTSYGNDLLGIMLAAASDSTDEAALDFNLASVFNNSKLIFFAGQDTVASLVTFALLQLARYPEWQDRARQEVFEVIGDSEAFDSGTISRLKIVGMILNEILRMFSIIPALPKVATKDMQVAGLFIPKGLIIEIPIAAFNQDPEIWGEDVHEFTPERFENGVAMACSNPQAFIPFSIGPKICIGKDFAMLEAKIVMAMVLRRFQLSPSPNYKHHPYHNVVTKPKYGMPLILRAL